MSQQGELLREIIENVLARQDDFSARFYGKLLTRYPEMRPLFRRNSPDAQQKLFTQKLVMLIDQHDAPEALAAQLAEIARTHQDYGVTPDMYAQVGEVLGETIAEALGEDWNEEKAEAVTRVWSAMTAIILRA